MISLREEEKFRYKLMLKLLFSMMFGWTSQRFQSLYEAGKIDNSLTLEVEVEELFHFVILTMDTQEPVSLSHQFRSAIKQFERIQMSIRNIWIRLKAKCLVISYKV